MAEIRTLAVLGAGDMGHGIAELAALAGLNVQLRDVEPLALDRAREKMRASLDKMASRSRITKEQADAAFARIQLTRDLAEAVRAADIIIEAVPEKLDLKQRVFAEVEAAAKPDAVLASNTSAIRIREIGEKLKDPSRLVGMHFFNPVMIMDLIEIIPAPATSRAAVAAAEELSARLKKTHVTLKDDTPGFVTSRLISVWVGAGVLAAEGKLGTREAIDSALKFKAGFPMGPFELADYTGLDIGVHASEYMASRLGDEYRAAPSMRRLVDEGLLGKKNGKGYYEWADGKMLSPVARDAGASFDPALVLALVTNEAAKLLDQGVASAREIDLAMRHGCAFPKGPLEWADEVGLDTVLKALYTLDERTGHPLAKPHESIVRMVEQGRLGKASGGGFYATEAPVATSAAPRFETVLYEVAGPIATVTINRPHRLNAINGQLIRDLGDALKAAANDERVRVVVLTGKGDKAFCAGADLQDAAGTTPANVAALARDGHWMCLAIEKMGKPVIAAVNGHALGGGLELTLPCDFRLAAKRASFGLPEVTLGLLPAMGGTQRLPRLVGLARAKEIALLGQRFSADQALAWGLVHRVFENDAFEKDVRAFAEELAGRAPLSLRKTKQLLNSAHSTDILMGMEAEATAFGVLASTEDMLEGVSAMFAKRKPEFQGK